MRSLLFGLFGVATAMECAELRTVYQESSCCGHDGNTCLRAIPDCDTVSNGAVCFNGTAVEVKGLLDYLGFESTHLALKKSLIPTVNNQFDLGNAEYKIRDIYEQDR